MSRLSVNLSGLHTKPGTSSPVQIRASIAMCESIEGEPRSLMDSLHRRMIGREANSWRLRLARLEDLLLLLDPELIPHLEGGVRVEALGEAARLPPARASPLRRRETVPAETAYRLRNPVVALAVGRPVIDLEGLGLGEGP